mgnify:CR=1 FL=1
MFCLLPAHGLAEQEGIRGDGETLIPSIGEVLRGGTGSRRMGPDSYGAPGSGSSVQPAGAAAAAAAGVDVAAAGGAGWRGAGLLFGGREHGQLLGQLGGAAGGTGGALPVRRADQHFTVFPALLAVEFVDRHGRNVAQQSAPRNGTTHARGERKIGRRKTRSFSQRSQRAQRVNDVRQASLRARRAWAGCPFPSGRAGVSNIFSHTMVLHFGPVEVPLGYGEDPL